VPDFFVFANGCCKVIPFTVDINLEILSAMGSKMLLSELKSLFKKMIMPLILLAVIDPLK
jgi:hypothetical protein